MRLFRPCSLAVRLFPEVLFREKITEKILFLTFDDGPNILSTVPLLGILGKHNIKAVFFCSGKSASLNPGLIFKMRSEGHIIGNHGYNHINGFCTSKKKYLNDIKEAAEVTSDCLFRPPYGRLRYIQYLELKKSYRIIMWDIMSYDFDGKFGSGQSLSVLKKMIRPGSVIVLHDNPQSTVLQFLEEFIVYATKNGYRFEIPYKT